MRITSNSFAQIRHSARKCFTTIALAFATLLCFSNQQKAFSQAVKLEAEYSSSITIDGNPSDWAKLRSGNAKMDTKGRGPHGNLGVDIQYSWDYTNLYILVKENTNYALASAENPAVDVADFQAGPYFHDTIGFWLDLDNNSGKPDGLGGIVFDNDADFQPWFGFSSTGRTDLIYARQNNSGNVMSLGGLANAKVATGGTFAKHNRTIEIAMAWADIAASVDSARQPEGDLTKAIKPGYTFGSEPLLVLYNYTGQAFIGPNPGSPGSGVDSNSRDIELIASAPVIDAAFTTGITVDGNVGDWASLSSGVVKMNTKGRGPNGTLEVDIKYAWNQTNLYILVAEKTDQYVFTAENPAVDVTDFQAGPYFHDTIGFWLDLDNNSGKPDGLGGIVFDNDADFQPWFGFSSTERTDLIYGRQNNSGNVMSLGGLANAKMATGGTFTKHNRTIEIAMAWADIAASVDSARQPGGDLTKVIVPGYTFGSEPLLVGYNYTGQAFIGPNPGSPGNGIDSDSRDIRLVSGAPVTDAAYTTGVTVDGNAADWASLSSGVVKMNTKGRGPNGTLEVDIKYAWNQTNLYILVAEKTDQYVFTAENPAADVADFQAGPYFHDTIGFWLDLDNNSGQADGKGGFIFDNDADFQPWFGFSSTERTDLIYGRQNNSGNVMSLGGLANAKMATGGTFAKHNRTIEIAMAWADIAASVDSARQPGGNLTTAIVPGYTFGSEPLLVGYNYTGQAFIGPNPGSPGNGIDSDSRDIKLVGSATISLKIKAGPGQIELSWPGIGTGYELQVSTGLNPANWVATGAPFQDVDGFNKIILPKASQDAAFYRLRKAQ